MKDSTEISTSPPHGNVEIKAEPEGWWWSNSWHLSSAYDVGYPAPLYVGKIDPYEEGQLLGVECGTSVCIISLHIEDAALLYVKQEQTDELYLKPGASESRVKHEPTESSVKEEYQEGQSLVAHRLAAIRSYLK